MDLFSKMWLLRRGGQVLRFHTEGKFDRQTVAEHTFGALLFLFEIAEPEQLTMNLIRAVLYHDLAEQTTGDLPSPACWRDHRAKTLLETDEENFLRHLGISSLPDLAWTHTQLNEEQALLEAADYLDLCYTALDSALNGRLDALSMLKRLWGNLARAQRTNITPRAKELYEYWLEASQELYSQQSGLLRTLAAINAWELHPAVDVSGIPKADVDAR